MIAVLSTTIVLCTAALMASLWAAVRVVRRTKEPLIPSADLATTNDLAVANMRFHAEMETLTFAIAEGIERTVRSENRVAKTVASARRLLASHGLTHPGLEAEAAQLADRDEGRSEEGELPEVPRMVGEARTVRIPGGRLEIGAA